MPHPDHDLYITQPDIERYAHQHSQAESALLQELTAFTAEKFPDTTMLSGPLVGNTLALLCRLMQARKILEIGTFTGYSALSMAQACPEDSEIFCI